MKLKRLFYLGYYIRELDRDKLRRFMNYATANSHKSRISLWVDIIKCCIKYNISILDYFYFRFFELKHNERAAYAGTGHMYEYQLKMNPKSSREVLENKISFLKRYHHFVKRRHATVQELISGSKPASRFLASPSMKLVLKGSRGQVGAEVEVVSCRDYNEESLILYMERKRFDLVEEFVVQHDDLMMLSPSGLNTVRIFTQLTGDEVVYLGARLRVTINSPVDNMAAGNIAAPIDMDTGRVCGPAVYSDLTKEVVRFHPVTGVAIEGFKIPFWNEILKMMENAAVLDHHNRSVGWDIGITNTGPELIEGNHNWCKLLWQLPVRRGLKSSLSEFA